MVEELVCWLEDTAAAFFAGKIKMTLKINFLDLVIRVPVNLLEYNLN